MQENLFHQIEICMYSLKIGEHIIVAVMFNGEGHSESAVSIFHYLGWEMIDTSQYWASAIEGPISTICQGERNKKSE